MRVPTFRYQAKHWIDVCLILFLTNSLFPNIITINRPSLDLVPNKDIRCEVSFILGPRNRHSDTLSLALLSSYLEAGESRHCPLFFPIFLNHLSKGEYAFDFTVVFISRSRYFQRLR